MQTLSDHKNKSMDFTIIKHKLLTRFLFQRTSVLKKILHLLERTNEGTKSTQRMLQPLNDLRNNTAELPQTSHPKFTGSSDKFNIQGLRCSSLSSTFHSLRETKNMATAKQSIEM